MDYGYAAMADDTPNSDAQERLGEWPAAEAVVGDAADDRARARLRRRRTGQRGAEADHALDRDAPRHGVVPVKR